jgi:hypothetical protein
MANDAHKNKQDQHGSQNVPSKSQAGQSASSSSQKDDPRDTLREDDSLKPAASRTHEDDRSRQ